MSERDKDEPRAERPDEDFEILRRNSAARAPKTVDEFLQFLAFANTLASPSRRLRPTESGHWRI